MAPKIVYLGAACLAAVSTTQAFLIPSSFNFPGVQKDSSDKHVADGKAGNDFVSTLPIATEDVREKLKNLQLGVSKPFPFTVPSGHDVEHANKKAKHYFKSVCKKLKKDASKFGNKAEGEMEELDRKILDWWKATVPSKMEEFEKDFKEFGDDMKEFEKEFEKDLNEEFEKDKDWFKALPDHLKNGAEDLEDELDKDWFKFWPDHLKESAEDLEDKLEEDWSKLSEQFHLPHGTQQADQPSRYQDDDQDDHPDEVGYDMGDVFYDEDPEEFWTTDGTNSAASPDWSPLPHDEDIFEDSESFRVWFYSPDEDEANDNDSSSQVMYVELVNMQTGERTRERIDLGALDLDLDNDNAGFSMPPKMPSKHIPHIHDLDLDISPEWQDKIRLSPHTRGRMRCAASKFRRVMHSLASGIRAFVTGFLIPVLIGVAAGMAASLLGMFVGTILGWLWVKLFRRSEPEDTVLVAYRDAGDGIGEKDTLLTVETVDSDEDAPPVYVEKE